MKELIPREQMQAICVMAVQVNYSRVTLTPMCKLKDQSAWTSIKYTSTNVGPKLQVIYVGHSS